MKLKFGEHVIAQEMHQMVYILMFYGISKHVKAHQEYSATRCVFNSLYSV